MKILKRDVNELIKKESHYHNNSGNKSLSKKQQHSNFSQYQTLQLSQSQNKKLIKFIEDHRFYSPQKMKAEQILNEILQTSTEHNKLSNVINSSVFIQQALEQLSLYLNRQNNKPIFCVYQHILKSGKTGISYEILGRKLNTDIINISHYCCKLKKMRFIEWEHVKQGIIVFSKGQFEPVTEKSSRRESQHSLLSANKSRQKKGLEQVHLNGLPDGQANTAQVKYQYSKSFLFNQLTLNENIWINVSGADSMLKNGLTNQEIKLKILKHAENKMVRRTVQSIQSMSIIDRTAERQGKVFEFKYKNQTPQLLQELNKQRSSIESSKSLSGPKSFAQISSFGTGLNSSIQPQPVLNKQCQTYLQQLFPNLISADQPLLLTIVNTKCTDYISSIGVKHSKRQCTPMKLTRYINILNKLHSEGPQSEMELRREIIEQETSNINNGIMHKRTLDSILEGLRKLNIIEEEDGYFYPKWKVTHKRSHPVPIAVSEPISQSKPKKKAKTESLLGLDEMHIPIITQQSHRRELFTNFVVLSLEKSLRRYYRKAFHRIMYVHRKKEGIPMFVPETNIFNFLNRPQQIKTPTCHSTNYNHFLTQIDTFIEKNGEKPEQYPFVEYQTVKYLRRNPMKNDSVLRSKYGKNWQQKFQTLENSGIIRMDEQGYSTISHQKQIMLI